MLDINGNTYKVIDKKTYKGILTKKKTKSICNLNY